MKSPVSDHALIRWIERIQGINLDPWRMEIASICAEALSAGATTVITDGGVFVLDAGKIVTILDPGQRPGRAKTFDRWQKREAAE